MDAPESVVVQILSLSKGVVRLSWLFRWNAEVLPSVPNRVQGFEVRLAADPAAKDAVTRWQCRSSPFQLELPVGHCYSLQLRAVLWEGATTVWASPFSAAQVDLRQNAGSKQRLEAAGKPSFQDFLAAKSTDRRVDPYRSSSGTTPRAPQAPDQPREGASPIASSFSTSIGDGVPSSDSSPSCATHVLSILELLQHQAVRKSFFDGLPMVMVARMRSASPAVKAQTAAYLHARVNKGARKEFDLDEEVEAPALPTQEVQIVEAKEVPMDQLNQLSHISGSLLYPQLLKTPRGTFRTEVAPRSEVERDLGRLAASDFRIFFTSSTACARPWRFQARQGSPILHDLHLLLEQQLSMTLDTSFSEQVAKAMSAGIGVDFAMQVGLIPQFHQPMFMLLLLGEGKPLQARLLVNGFVAAKSKHVQGDRPDQKYTPWIASLASPDLMERLPSAWQWEYLVRDANGSETTGSALECDVLLLQDMARSGRWNGLPELH